MSGIGCCDPLAARARNMPLSNVKRLEDRYLLGTYRRYDILIERGSGPGHQEMRSVIAAGGTGGTNR